MTRPFDASRYCHSKPKRCESSASSVSGPRPMRHRGPGASTGSRRRATDRPTLSAPGSATAYARGSAGHRHGWSAIDPHGRQGATNYQTTTPARVTTSSPRKGPSPHDPNRRDRRRYPAALAVSLSVLHASSVAHGDAQNQAKILRDIRGVDCVTSDTRPQLTAATPLPAVTSCLITEGIGTHARHRRGQATWCAGLSRDRWPGRSQPAAALAPAGRAGQP